MILIASGLTIVAFFSTKFVKAYTLGDGSAQMVTAIIQIICLLIGGSSQKSGYIYFGIGTSMFIIALCMFIGTGKSAFFR